MSRLIIPTDILNNLQKKLFSDGNEACAVLFGRAVFVNNQLARIVVYEAIYPEIQDYLTRTSTSAQLSPEFVATVGKRVKMTGQSAVFVHTHPFPFNEFSKIDDEGEKILASFLKGRNAGSIHAAMLITPETMLARVLGGKSPLKIFGVGQNFYFNPHSHVSQPKETFDRQIRVFGTEGQTVLESLRIAIVGLGGTGSIIAQQLAHLGVRDFTLFDPDTLEITNLNRVVGSTHDLVGKSKVEVAKQLILHVNPHASVETNEKSVLLNKVLKQLVNADIIFSCTDSHGSRALINQIAYQYLVPTIDMGVVISVADGKIEHIAARTQLLTPGEPCMVCGNILDPEEIRRDLLTDFERKNDSYILNYRESAPAVISLNSTIASMAITMFLNYVVGIPGEARFIHYNAITGNSRRVSYLAHPTCVVCSKDGSLGKADDWYLPGRDD